MRARKKIPVIKNRLTSLPNARGHSGKKTGYIITIFVLMLVFVWLRVQTSQLLSEVRTLEDELRKSQNENRHLETQEKKLSTYSRIMDLAQNRLNMVKVPNDRIIKVKEKE
jgi:cell division protein FtsL